ncbi:hypothetical protein RI129_000322 [Pyrocoelia pectoralis]|uniref:TTF-type domain-containing protein n=1 Tax=Pyrocoelia pectoralis TaxID=417401 RepID=A0AAN7VSI4_9COLE
MFSYIKFITCFQVMPEERENLLNNAWKPEECFHFPSTKYGKRQLKFQHNWLKTREWLVYSKKLDGAFCKYCMLFAPAGAGKQGLPLGKLVRVKYSDWRHALEDFNKHQMTTYHANAKVAAENFLSARSNKIDIISCLDKSVANKVTENRRLLTPVIKTVIFCGRQGLALRGHRDGGPLNINDNEDFIANEGNFRALLRLRLDSGDQDLKEHLLKAGKNATYISSVSQNEIISSCNDILLPKIVAKVNKAKCFSILADETTDISCVEQMTLCARYVDLESVTVREDFLQFVPIYDMSGKGIGEVIMRKLREFGIDTDNLYGQGYDGASAMSGAFSGVQALVRKEVPNALYVHCSSHSLSLAISDSCSLPLIKNCMGTVGKVYDFFNTPKRQAVLRKHSDPQYGSKRLKALCPTRWTQRHNSVNTLCEMFEAILRSLEEICNWPDTDTSTNANLLLCAVQKCEFTFMLHIIKKVFSYTLPLTKYLQSENIDLISAVTYAEHTVNELQKIRDNSEEEFADIFKSVEAICSQEEITIKVPRTTGRQTTRENVPHDSPETYFRRAAFIPFLDHVIIQIKERFTAHKETLSSFEVLLNETSEDKVYTERLFGQYKNSIAATDASQLFGEIKIWHQKLKQVELERVEQGKKLKKTLKKINAIEALSYCEFNMYASVHKLLQIMATLPVTTCSAERSFSTLRYLKTYLRSTTSETRLNGLAMLYVHKDISVSVEEVFAEMAKKSRRTNIKL